MARPPRERAALVVYRVGGDVLYFNSEQLALDYAIASEPGPARGRAAALEAACETHDALNIINNQPSHSLARAELRAAVALSKSERAAVRSVRRKANLARHSWPPVDGQPGSSSEETKQQELEPKSDILEPEAAEPPSTFAEAAPGRRDPEQQDRTWDDEYEQEHEDYLPETAAQPKPLPPEEDFTKGQLTQPSGDKEQDFSETETNDTATLALGKVVVPDLDKQHVTRVVSNLVQYLATLTKQSPPEADSLDCPQRDASSASDAWEAAHGGGWEWSDSWPNSWSNNNKHRQPGGRARRPRR